MRKLHFTFLFCIITLAGFTQKNPPTADEQAALDSMLNNDEFVKMMMALDTPKSYFALNLGIGNSNFSIKNKRLNATQQQNKFVFKPGAGYYHKSGLALSTTAYLMNYNGQMGFYQYNLTPSYSVAGKKADAYFSYTRTFRRTGFEEVASPFKNELFVTTNLKKPWLQPGISLSFSNGQFAEYNLIDTVFMGIRRIFMDTAKTTLSNFNTSFFVQHSFKRYEVFNKDDGLEITPQLSINAGSDRFSLTHQNPVIPKPKKAASRKFKHSGKKAENNSFTLQSLSLSMDLNYSIGKFGIVPQAYVDYYIPITTDNKFSGIYSLALSYTF